ncbi:hypothetical protein FQ087_10995 [Sporosarcina sp. ANT_H38]|uniref:UPF0738 family protein n=1 Tax=Sporosarcina sp. ANT_H38 TaxID=2597358 RepID=UPI0011F37F91|nr:hypothetical protein [Sporosarcina sp. ANT_H38]KAA0966721.1 hypothetical protein FQ087_10995 [Sporosarcina sp. ANT_H38]
MNFQNRIDNGLHNDEQVLFLLAEGAVRPLGIPSGKMITDSDNFSFVYLLELEEGYQQLHFTQAVWPLMVDTLTMDADPMLSWKDEIILLPGFKDELTMLIYNIEGNDNYGEAFSSAVEQAFSSILQHTE